VAFITTVCRVVDTDRHTKHIYPSL